MDKNQIQTTKSKHMTFGKLILSSLTIGALLTGCGICCIPDPSSKQNTTIHTNHLKKINIA